MNLKKILQNKRIAQIHKTQKKYFNYSIKQQEYPQSVDVAIIGGGHNGLVSSFYLSKQNLKTAIFENRHIIGGAAVTEEIVPGFRFSRASYLLSLFRPQIMQDMNLFNRKNGLVVYDRNPDSFTPLSNNKDYLLMGDNQLNYEQISKFSKRDAEVYAKYQAYIMSIVKLVDPLFDEIPVDFKDKNSSIFQKIQQLLPVIKRIQGNTHLIPDLVELLTAPTKKILDQWFESEPLKATLAYDSIIGAMISPYDNGSSYVLLHHFMDLNPNGHGWRYVQGGMGALTQLLQEVTQEEGTQIFTESRVKQVLLSENGKQVEGIELENGAKIKAQKVLSNATAFHTYTKLCPEGSLEEEFLRKQKSFDYKSPVFKINVAVSKIPEFTCIGKKYEPGESGPEHRGTIHLGADNLEEIHKAYTQAENGQKPSERPLIEMSIPTSQDKTLVDDKTTHTIGLFVQYTPYDLPWENKEYKEKYVNKVFDVIEEYAPGFKQSVVGYDALSPKDIENTIGLTGGNIFQGSMSLDQLYFNRNNYRSSISGLYLCGSSAHPGGGVTGAPGRNCAKIVLMDQ